MKIMLSCLEKPIDLTSSVLYTHIRKKEESEQSSESEIAVQDNSVLMTKQMRTGLLSAIENDEQFAFLGEKKQTLFQLI